MGVRVRGVLAEGAVRLQQQRARFDQVTRQRVLTLSRLSKRPTHVLKPLGDLRAQLGVGVARLGGCGALLRRAARRRNGARLAARRRTKRFAQRLC